MNRALIQKWIRENAPQGKAKLAARTEVSMGTITNILNDGHEPGLDIARRIAAVIGVSLDELSNPTEGDASPAA